MPTIVPIINKDGTTSFKAIVRYKGIFKSKTFSVKGNRKKTVENDAFVWGCEIEKQINEGVYRKEEKRHNYTVAQAIDKYMKDGNPKNKPEKVRKQYISTLNWFKKEIGNIPIKVLDRADLKACRNKLQKKHKEIPIKGGKSKVTNELITNSTVNRYLAYFSIFLTYCVDEYEILNANPMIGAKLKLKENVPRKRWLKDLNERKELLQACLQTDYELYLCVLIGLLTGARKGEIISLTWANTDLENKAIYFLDTKNGEDRTIPIPDLLLDELKEFKEQRKVRHLKDDYVFATPEGKPNDHLIGKIYPNVVKKCSFEPITFHGLRHTYISISSLLGTNPSITKKIVGHKFDSVTGGYTHADCESLRKPMNDIAHYMLFGTTTPTTTGKKQNI